MSADTRIRGLMSYQNVPKTIATVVSSGKASYTDLGSVLGLEDMWDLLEIVTIDAHNQRILNTPKD